MAWLAASAGRCAAAIPRAAVQQAGRRGGSTTGQVSGCPAKQEQCPCFLYQPVSPHLILSRRHCSHLLAFVPCSLCPCHFLPCSAPLFGFTFCLHTDALSCNVTMQYLSTVPMQCHKTFSSMVGGEDHRWGEGCLHAKPRMRCQHISGSNRPISLPGTCGMPILLHNA